MPLSPGDKLGPYELLAPIGEGGMGEVWKARDPRLNRVVAIKRLKGKHAARFEQEAHAIAALNHANICTLHDIGPDYLVMEFVEGKPLTGPLPVGDVLRLAGQIAEALEEAHAKGILHRDLKPANILVTQKGSAKLLDFGLAKLVSNADTGATLTLDGTVLGTPAYMAPEQAEGKALDARSDIFSFGAVLYEMLSGRRAFPGESTAMVLSAVLRDDSAPLDAPAGLQSIVRRCLAKRPADRFANVGEIRAALAQISVAPAEQPQPSIAVLPFADMSVGKDHEWFSDGIAEEIINLLAHIPGVKAIARTSAFAFKGKNEDIRKIAGALGTANIVEGSVRKAGNRIRVTAQLIEAANGTHLWSERYDRDITDIFAVQDEIAAAIAGALQVKLCVAPAAARHYKPSLPAYEAYLKGMHHMLKLTPESLQKGREYFEQATRLDPGYAVPHGALGMHFAALGVYGMRPAHDVIPLARGAARRALEIDPMLPEAHAVLGIVAGFFDYNWSEAGRLFGLATAHDPVPPLVRFMHGYDYLLPIGRTDEAIEEAKRAIQEDPLNLATRDMLEFCLLTAGRYEDAAMEAHRILELDENRYQTCFHLGLIETGHGRLAEALAFAERACSLAPWDHLLTGGFAGLLMRTGDPGRAHEVLVKLGDGQEYHAPLGFVLYHLILGEIDSAADWAEKAIEQRGPTLIFLLRLPLAAPLRASARWPKLAKMMNLPDGNG